MNNTRLLSLLMDALRSAIKYAGDDDEIREKKALEIDTSYQPALVNKLAVEQMKEGEPLTQARQVTTEYYRELAELNRRAP